jgi:hypothetical protein
MKADNVNQHLHDLLVTRDFDPIGLSANGNKQNVQPHQAVSFSFDYKGKSGKDYGTAVVSISNDGLNLFFGDNIGKTMEPEDKEGWFAFLSQLKNFAVRENLPGGFNVKDIAKLKYSMQGQAAIREGLFEGWSGNKTQSWNGIETEARLMIKHKKVIGENDARFRYIESLFVETADGEKFKLPFTKLAGGRAMVEHVRQGGKPYDLRGNHISTIVQEMNLLSRFKRANQGKIFEGDTAHLVESANMYYETLQHNLKSLSSKTGYKKYFESWDPTTITDEDVIIEDLRHMFVEQNIDSRVEQALPLLAKLQQEQKMKEANIFEEWANSMVETDSHNIKQAFPETREQQAELIELLSSEVLVGADGFNAISELNDLFVDAELYNKLKELAKDDPDADARDIIKNRILELNNIPAMAEIISKLPAEPAAAAPAAAAPAAAPNQNALSEITRLAGVPLHDKPCTNCKCDPCKCDDHDYDELATRHKHHGYHPDRPDDFEESRMDKERSGDYEFDTTIINPAWYEWESSEETEDNPLPPEPEKTIGVTVTYNTFGNHHSATWGDAGGSPAEGLEYEIVTINNNDTGEPIDPSSVDLTELESDARHDQESNMEESREEKFAKARNDKQNAEDDIWAIKQGRKDESREPTSALAGPYGHSGRMKAVEGVDADMMERIKFLAGVTK